MPSNKTRSMVRAALQRDGWTDGNSRTAQSRRLSQGFRYDSTSADGQSLHADDGQDRHGTGMPPGSHLDAADYQGGASQFGRRMSASGGAGDEQNPAPIDHINHRRNKRTWPAGAEVSASHKGRVGRKGGVRGSNASGPDKNWYSAGHGRARG